VCQAIYLLIRLVVQTKNFDIVPVTAVLYRNVSIGPSCTSASFPDRFHRISRSVPTIEHLNASIYLLVYLLGDPFCQASHLITSFHYRRLFFYEKKIGKNNKQLTIVRIRTTYRDNQINHSDGQIQVLRCLPGTTYYIIHPLTSTNIVFTLIPIIEYYFFPLYHTIFTRIVRQYFFIVLLYLVYFNLLKERIKKKKEHKYQLHLEFPFSEFDAKAF